MKRIAIGVGVLVIGVAVGLWRCHAPKTKKGGAPAGHVQGTQLPLTHVSPDRTLPTWFVTHGARPRRIAGRVTYRGAPVKDALVSLQSMVTRAGVAPALEFHTGPDGRFDFGIRPAALYDLAASMSGTTAAILHIDLADPTLKPPSDQLELRLGECTASVEGTIYDASGNPLPKVRVRRNGLVGVDSDARGAYKLCVPFADVELEYAADGYGSVTLTINARGDMHRDVVLVPAATVMVRVVRADNDQPVPAAHVWVFSQEWGPDRPAMVTGITDADGRVRIDGLVPGRYRVNGFAENLASQTGAEVLAEVGASPEVVLRLETTARITGRVVNGTTPVAGAQVMAVRKSPSTRSPQAISQADGSFVLDRVPAGDLVFVAAPHEVTSPAQFKAEAGKSYDGVVLDVRSLGAIRGRVTRLGKPVAGIDVCCVRTIAGREPTAVSDAEGRYEFLGVAPGTYDVGGGSDALGAFTLGRKVTIGAGEERVVDLELDMAGTIAGVVVDREGHPVKGVFVRWIHEKSGDLGRSMTDAQGRYRCGAMTGGGVYRAAVFPSAELRVPYPTADGAPYPALEVKDGTTVIEGVKLAIDRPELSISGRVVDDSGAPVADAVVKALPVQQGRPPQFNSWLRLPMTSTDADGQFTIGELAPGSYAIQARAVDGAEGVLPPIAAGTKGVTVRIERPGSIAGKLVGYTQPPTIYALPVGTFKLISGSVDGASYRVAGLRPGRYLVNAQTTYEGDARVVEVRAGQTANVNFTSHGRGTIEGTVLDFRTRAPIANVICHVVMAVDGEQTVTNWDLSSAPKSDARGHITLDPAPAGNVSVTCEQPRFRWSRPAADVTLSEGGHANVQLFAVELTQENPGTIGIELDWRTTPPRISLVQAGTPAAKAGILVGDLVTEVNGTAVQGLNGPGVSFLIESTPIGEDVRLHVVRGGVTKTFTAKMLADID